VRKEAVLKALTERVGVANRITWTGMISGSLKWGALTASEVFVLPSHQENSGIVVAEALACKLLVIISNKWSELPESERAELRHRSLKRFNACFNYDVIAVKVLEVTESIARERRRS
jgi:hypothetical protein